MKFLIVGDVYSKLGRQALEENLKKIRAQEKINFIVVNGENTTHGRGLNITHYNWFRSLDINAITLGNHAFHNKSIYTFIDEDNNLIRALNYKDDVPGKKYLTVNYNGLKITVFQVLGTVFMKDEVTCPFKATEELLQNVKSDIYICDFHGEATSEKIAFGNFFDGRVHIIFGTHTHVQTNDARIFPKGTAYITDVGMTGPYEGIIGVKKDIIIERFVDDGRRMFKPENSGKRQFNAIIVDFNERSKISTRIDIINIVE